ncbi:MAG: hypothetical protein QM813_22650 [Verrucomicrobiota bacterium]
MPFNRVSLGFAQFTDTQLSDFYTTTYAGLNGSTVFANLPIPLADYQTLGTTFIEKLAAAADGGRLATAEKVVARAALVEAMRLIASYVQSVAGTNLPVLLTSGFQPVASNTVQTPLPKPVVENIDNFQSTMAMFRLKAIPNMRTIEARRRVHATGDYQAAGLFTQARKIKQDGLVPGTSYDWQFRAVGGSTGYSDWSDPITHMAT